MSVSGINRLRDAKAKERIAGEKDAKTRIKQDSEKPASHKPHKRLTEEKDYHFLITPFVY